MKILKRNKAVIIFYVAIVFCSMLWMWREERLEKNINHYDAATILDIKY